MNTRDWQCDECKSILCHKDMFNEEVCYDCWNDGEYYLKRSLRNEFPR